MRAYKAALRQGKNINTDEATELNPNDSKPLRPSKTVTDFTMSNKAFTMSNKAVKCEGEIKPSLSEKKSFNYSKFPAVRSKKVKLEAQANVKLEIEQDEESEDEELVARREMLMPQAYRLAEIEKQKVKREAKVRFGYLRTIISINRCKSDRPLTSLIWILIESHSLFSLKH